MTCKDCKKRNKCFDWHKDRYQNWADICTSFESKHKSRYVKKHGYVAMQLGQTFDVLIYDGMGAVLYSKKCSTKISRFVLRKILNNYLRNEEIETLDKQIETLKNPQKEQKQSGAMQVKNILHRKYGYFEEWIGDCPSCNLEMNKTYNYCPYCGQRLDWGG